MSLTTEIKIEGLAELQRDIKKAGGDAKPLVKAALANSAERTKQEMRRRAPHATGTLQRSILPEVKYPIAEVKANENYAAAIEFGSRPHTPPYKAIERWTSKKGIPGSAIWPIIKHIEKKGTKKQPFFVPGYEAAQDYISDQFTKVVDRLMSVLNGKGR